MIVSYFMYTAMTHICICQIQLRLGRKKHVVPAKSSSVQSVDSEQSEQDKVYVSGELLDSHDY